MKDDLPDLTPYLNKKGGNSQGRGDDPPAGKTDISQKLSALVKKSGNTGTHSSLQAAINATPVKEQNIKPATGDREIRDRSSEDALQEAAKNLPLSDKVDKKEAGDRSDTDMSPIGIIRPQIPDQASRASAPLASAINDSNSRWGDLGAFGAQPWSDNTDQQVAGATSDNTRPSGTNSFSRLNSTSPPAVLHNEDNNIPSPSRDVTRPGQPSDKLRAPQPKPLSTLSSSSAPPLLKTPPKQPGRPAQPYSYKPLVESGNETMAPKGLNSAPINKSRPQPTATPKPVMPQPNAAPNTSSNAQSNMQSDTFATTDRFGPGPTSTPAPAAPSTAPAQSRPSAPRPELQGPGQYQPQPQFQGQSSPARAERVESDAEKLARAFMEEAKALQDAPRNKSLSSDVYLDESQTENQLSQAPSGFTEEEQEFAPQDYQPETQSAEYAAGPDLDLAGEAASVVTEEFGAAAPALSQDFYLTSSPAPQETGPKSSLSSLFDSGVLNSRNQDEVPKKTIGFGHLLAASPVLEDDQKHSTFADLMVPTGEHDALFAPDRREPSDTSAFDEIAAQVNADEESVIKSLSPGPLNELSPDSASIRMDNKSEAPAFSSLFSNEIVTSGQDFSNRDNSISSVASSFVDSAGATNSDLLEPEPIASEDESRPLNPKSLAINKLIEAVNQGESREFAHGTTDGTTADLFSSEIVGASAKPVVSELEVSESEVSKSDISELEASGSDHSGQTPDPGALSPSALEALAAFVPKVGEEQHETKGLLAKLKAKDAAVKAAQKAEAANKSQGKIEAKPIERNALNTKEESQPASAASPNSLASLLSKSQPAEEVKAKAQEPKNEPEEDDQSSGNTLGDAISNALDKLLGDDELGQSAGQFAGPASDTASEVMAEVPSVPIEEAVSAADNDRAADPTNMPISLNKLLDDDPDRFNRPINSNMKGAEEVLERVVTTSAEVPASIEAKPEESHPLTLTNSKVDALSRLLEVASKAPHKTAEGQAKGTASSNKLSEMINKPPGKISRKLETMSSADYPAQSSQPTKNDAYTSPFGGGTSPFNSPSSSYSGPGSQPSHAPASSSPGSPFGTPVNSTNSGVSLNHTPAGSFSPTGQSQPVSGGFAGTGSMADMPKASGIASDAISARIAALNRKLEEQTKSPSASGTVSAMAPTAPSLALQQDPPPLTQMPATPASTYVPNPIVDDSPQTRAELVNRILGSAKISQTALPDLPARAMPEMAADPTQAQMHGQKGQKNSPPKSQARARGGKPGFDVRTLLLVLILVAIVGVGGMLAMKDGHLKNGFDFGKLKTTETKATVDQLIKSGDFDKALEILETKKESGKFSSIEGEKLYGLYYVMAERAYKNDDNPAEAMKLLEKIPSKTKKFRDAQKFMRKIKKKAKRN